jgi:hypothetical protein
MTKSDLTRPTERHPRRMRGRSAGFGTSAAFRRLWLLAVLTVTGCASLSVVDTKPLAPSQLEPIGAERISHGGYRFDELPIAPETPDRGGRPNGAKTHGSVFHAISQPTRSRN